MGQLTCSFTGVRLVVIVAAAAVSLTGCESGRRDAAIVGASLASDRTLVLTIRSCGAKDNRAEVDERAESVTIRLTTDDPVGGDDCLDGLTVQLRSPLDDRKVIDGATSETLVVYDDR